MLVYLVKYLLICYCRHDFCIRLLYKYTFGFDFFISGGVFYVRVRKPNTNQIQELMNTILTVILQISGGLRTEVNTFLSEYAVDTN